MPLRARLHQDGELGLAALQGRAAHQGHRLAVLPAIPSCLPLAGPMGWVQAAVLLDQAMAAVVHAAVLLDQAMAAVVLQLRLEGGHHAA